MVPLADSTMYEMEQCDEFPRRFRLSLRRVAWNLAEVKAWLENRRSKPIAPARSPDARQRRLCPIKGQYPAQTRA
ncbi:helix-turn-helix transcriptional regulator [Komagataeibacter intermedius]|uniref:helix-turn-helix transcriptional regulator n=2 Tax=Komagataeibacter intermedius TaxID=66229 RepID=UPI0009E2CD73|nr:AlpA family phage regulatory protein [Komagataeibacter intermedius]